MEGYIGEIRLFAGTFAPRDWQFCHGQIMPISGVEALYSIIGNNYGGDGRTTVGLPDLRSRVPVGAGQSPGHHSYSVGQIGGYESVILTEGQLPAHTHVAQASATSALTGGVDVKIPVADESEETTPLNGYAGASASTLYGEKGAGYMGAPEVDSTLEVTTSVNVAVGQAGGSQAVCNVQPFLGLNYIICVNGMYPSRS